MCKATVSPVITMSDKLIRLQNFNVRIENTIKNDYIGGVNILMII